MLAALALAVAAPTAGAADVVARFLGARTAAEARALVAREWDARRLALAILARRGDDGDPARIVAQVGTIDRISEWQPRRCRIGPGSRDERRELVPAAFPFRPSDEVRRFIVETRARLDAAELLVARCPADEEFLVLVQDGTVLAWAARLGPPEPPTPLLVAPWREALFIDAWPSGGRVELGRLSAPLPFSIPEIDAAGQVTVRVPDRIPESFRPFQRERPGPRRGGASWFVVPFPDR